MQHGEVDEANLCPRMDQVCNHFHHLVLKLYRNNFQTFGQAFLGVRLLLCHINSVSVQGTSSIVSYSPRVA